MISRCIEIQRVTEHLDKIVSKLLRKDRKFVIIDVDTYTVLAPGIGFFECGNFTLLKSLVEQIIKEHDIDKIYIGKNIDERWLEENIPLFVQDIEDPSRINLLTLGKVLGIIPTKRKGLLTKHRIDAGTVLNALDLYASLSK